MKLFIAKIAVAVVAIGAVVLVAAGQIVPGLAAWKVLLVAAAFVALLFVVALVLAFVTGSLRQLLLRWGAIDTQWLWMPDYPEGFKRHWRGRPVDGTDKA